MTTPLLTTKLYIPPPRPNLVPRPRLVERLDAGLGRKLILVSAPAGFGKTTLLSEWIQGGGLRDPRFAWLSLDEDDNDPAHFFAYFIAALETVQPDVGTDARSLLQSPRPQPLKSVLTLLINSLAGALAGDPPGRSLVLVLDDYHVVEEPAIHEGVMFLIDHMPPQLHLVIATRSDPPLSLAGLRARGHLAELRAAALRFTPDETADFLNRVMGLNLAATDIAALESRTEGWIAGLQLAALSMQGDEDIPGFVAAFAGSQRYILDYLVEEVLQRQPEHVQSFLLQTSILDRLSGPLCDAVLGRDEGRRGAAGSSASVLEYLEHANLFLVPLDDHREWFRYHHLFADFLRARARLQFGEGGLATLHLRASEWYERHAKTLEDTELMAEAIDHAIFAGDLERAARLIEMSAEWVLMRSEVATLLSWTRRLSPDAIHARPLLWLYHTGMQILQGCPLDVVEAGVQEIEVADRSGSIAGEIAAFRGLLSTYQGDGRRSAELARQALERLPGERIFLRSLVAGYLGLNYIYSGDFAAARWALDESMRIGREVGNLMTIVLAQCHLAELAVIQGQLREAIELYERALNLAVDGEGRPRPIAGLALIGMGRVLHELDDQAGAGRCLTQGIELIKRWGEVAAVSGYTGLARLKQSQGDLTGANEAIQKAREIARKFDAMEIDDLMVDWQQVDLWLARGHLEAAASWAESRRGALDEQRQESFSLPRVFECRALARIYLALDRTSEALELLEPARKAAERSGWTFFVIQALILQALALRAQGDIEQALEPLERALALAEPGGWVRIFVDEGQPMAAMLSHVLARSRTPGVAPDYVARLLAAFPSEMRVRPPRPDSESSLPRASLLIEPLSDRELEVLRLIAAGLSNREIAQELVVAISTVKTHVNNIYRKLDVSRRTQAVARAKELNLLYNTRRWV